MNPIIDPTGNIQAPLEAAITSMTGGVLAGIAGANPLGALTAAQNETLNNWAAHVGLSGSVTLGGATYTGGVGVAADDKGNTGWYTSFNQNNVPGVGFGGRGSVGISVGSYPGANTIMDLGGPFNTASFGAGLGPYGYAYRSAAPRYQTAARLTLARQVQGFGGLLVEPCSKGCVRLRFHRFGNHVGIQNDHSNLIGSAGVLSRAWSKIAKSSFVRPTLRPKAAKASPKRTRFSGFTALERISRTSASVLCPCCAARSLRARCTSSGTLRTVRTAIVKSPSVLSVTSIIALCCHRRSCRRSCACDGVMSGFWLHDRLGRGCAWHVFRAKSARPHRRLSVRSTGATSQTA